jgi:hypothetical protein
VQPSESFAKGTANHSGTDIDLFISLKSDTKETLKETYTSFRNKMQTKGYSPKDKNVSLNVRVSGYDVDLIPAKHQGGNSEDHSLYRRRAGTWTQTNVVKHISTIRTASAFRKVGYLSYGGTRSSSISRRFTLSLPPSMPFQAHAARSRKTYGRRLKYLRDTFPNTRSLIRLTPIT